MTRDHFSPSTLESERRGDARAGLRELASVTTEDGRSVLLEVIDISVSGLRLKHSGPPMGIAQHVELELEVGDESIHVSGRVVNLSQDSAGIEFVGLSEDDKVTLELFTSAGGWG